MPFLEGLLIGVSMIVFIGPVVFTLLKGALQYGFLAGWAIAIGILVSDVVCVLLCSFGAVPFFKNPENQVWLAFAGAIILFVLGIKYLWRPNVNFDTEVKLKTSNLSGLFVQGFLVNFLNPFVFVVWIGLIGYGQTKFESSESLITFLGAILLGIFISDTVKAYFAQKVKSLIRPKFLKRLFQAFGILLIVFGTRMLWFVYQNLSGSPIQLTS